MSLDLLVQAVVSPKGGAPNFDAAKDARLKLQASLVFLDGKKLGALRTLDHANFQQLDACLIWTAGPSVHVRFRDAESLEVLKLATEAAKKRALKSQSSVDGLSAQAAQPTGTASIGTPPQTHAARRRPLLELDARGSSQKQPLHLFAESKSHGKGMTVDEVDEPLAPVVDATLSEEDRHKRRRLAAACADQRVTQIQTRGIGDVTYVQRIQDRAEREELIGRITERYATQRKEMAWNLGGAPLAELRAHLRSLTKDKGL